MVMTRATELRYVTPPAENRPPVVALVLGREERARIEQALAGEHALTFVSTLDAVRSALTPLERAVLIVETCDERRLPSAPLVRQLLATRCDLPVIGYCAVPRDESSDIRDLARAGVHDLLFRNATDSPFLIRQSLGSAVQAWAASTILERVGESLSAELRQVVHYCLYHPKRATTVGKVAKALGIHRRTLTNYCARAGIPVPGALVAWCRLLLAAHLLRSQLGTVEAVALQLDFPSATALRNMLKRYTGLRPADVRAGPGMEQMIEMFEAALHARRPPQVAEPAHSA